MDEEPGWAFLLQTQSGLELRFLPGESSPVLENIGYPLMCIDLWEHAYYLRYFDDRARYISDMIGSIDWGYVNSRYTQTPSL